MRFLPLLLLFTAACGPAPLTPSQQLSLAYQAMPTPELWRRHATTVQPQPLFMIVAELGARGQMDQAGLPLGTRTAGSVGRSIFERGIESGRAPRDCTDFNSAALAQKAFLAAGGPMRDPLGLDRDGDGFACDWGAELRANVDGGRLFN